MPKGHYVDNAMNRSLGRVGMERGTAVHSSSGGGSLFSSHSSGTYVDNSFNRSLGRVGLDHGTAVHSSSGGGSSFSSHSSGTYVDNSFNRSLGRVGLEHGSAVHSRSGSSETSTKTYVDNAYNRRLDRVGLEHGSAVHSRSGSSETSTKTYADNAYNRKLDRVGLQHGSAVVSKSGLGELNERLDKMTLNSPKCYKDNPLNRRLGRAGKPLGTCVVSKTGEKPRAKCYVNNAFNRRQGRVGKPLGSAPVRDAYRDTEFNRRLKRVGKPWGTCPDSQRANRDKMIEIIDALMSYLQRQNTDRDDFCFDGYGLPEEEEFAVSEYAINHLNRQEEVAQWQEATGTTQEPRTDLEKADGGQETGHLIPYEDLEVGKQIGRGSFGEVFFAKWKGTVVAMKKLTQQNVSRRRLKDFDKEVRLVCKLRHENIVTFLGACVEPPNLCIVMEFMEISLFDALHYQQFEFNDKEKILLLRQVSAGLGYLHEMGVAHCDIKAQNVLLNVPAEDENEDGFDYRNVEAKITDFGLSMMKSETETSASQDVRFGHRGTPRYSAPEVHRGEMLNLTQYTKADIFSMGILMLEVAVEEEPFYGITKAQLLKHVGAGLLVPTVPDDIELTKEFYGVVTSCWKFDPDERPSGRELLETINDLQQIIKVN